MKLLTVFLTLIMASNVWANGEYTIFNCTSGTKSGDVVTISGCVSGEGNEVIACGSDSVGYVTVTKEHWAGVPKMTPPVVEIVKYPSVYAEVQLDEEAFSLDLNEKSIGKIDLKSAMNPVNKEGYDQLVLKTKNFNNSFKVVGCTFTPSPM